MFCVGKSGSVSVDGLIKVTQDCAQVFGDIVADTSVKGIEIGGKASTILGAVSNGTVSTGDIKLNTISGKILASATGGSVSFGDITIGTAAADAQTVSEEAAFSAADGEKAAPEGTTTSTSPTEPAVTGMQTLFGAVSNGATVSGKALNLNGKDVKNVLFASADGAKSEIKGFQVAAGAIHGGIVGPVSNGAKVSGFGVNVGAVQSDLIGDVSGSSTIDGLTVTLTSLDGKLIASSTNSSIRNITANGLGAITQSVIGPVFGGSVEKASFGVSTISTTLIESISSKATLDGVTLTADSMTVADGKTSGVLVSSVPSGSTVKNSKVTISGTLDATASSTFGGLVGSNEGTLEKNTVSITAFKVSGDGSFGGLTGTSKGSVTSNTVTADISHSGGTEGVTIGGLVGNMSGGSLNGDQVSGKISGSAVGSSKIGGAVGSMADGKAENVTVSVTVDAAWAVPEASSATFGGKPGNGPVGMFVGYAGAGTLTDCKSTAANSTYQFVGQVGFDSAGTYGSGIWLSESKHNSITAYSDSYNSETKQYTSLNPANVTIRNMEGQSYSTVAVSLSGCTFKLGSDNLTQTYGYHDYFYNRDSQETQKNYSTTIVETTTTDCNSLKFNDIKDWTSDWTSTNFYVKESGQNSYSKLYIKTSIDEGYFDDYTKYHVKWGSNEYSFTTKPLSNPISSRDTIKSTLRSRQNKTVDIVEIVLPSLSDNTSYIIKSGDNAYTSVGDAIGTTPFASTFVQRDPMCNAIWTYNGDGKWTSDATGGVSTGNGTGFTAATGADYYETLPVTEYTFNGTTCTLYTVSENGNANYTLDTFSLRTDVTDAYGKQYLTAVASANPAEASTEETTTPAGESGGEA